ncbi:hypothetical protein LBCZ_P1-0028 (plasmid) [Lactobacillus casei subsp. casei ATCC 393] [Lacticaseibacillus rhamnosus]|nr:hypothetical protein LBCZ_P1-0028 (plasmid) [Lactobacillus casei subsp. casei ATCC 393] [Lacticaseibacillus rhamnosus]
MQKRIDLANQTFGRLTVISFFGSSSNAVSYTHLRAHETEADLVCRLLLEKKNTQPPPPPPPTPPNSTNYTVLT